MLYFLILSPPPLIVALTQCIGLLCVLTCVGEIYVGQQTYNNAMLRSIDITYMQRMGLVKLAISISD